MTIAWFSCGATSAVACKLALQMYDDVRIFYIETNSGHPDNERFIKDCERWYGQPIERRQSTKYKDAFGKEGIVKKIHTSGTLTIEIRDDDGELRLRSCGAKSLEVIKKAKDVRQSEM